MSATESIKKLEGKMFKVLDNDLDELLRQCGDRINKTDILLIQLIREMKQSNKEAKSLKEKKVKERKESEKSKQVDKPANPDKFPSHQPVAKKKLFNHFKKDK